MPINVELRQENGTVVGRAAGDGVLERLAVSTDISSPCLRFLDPYGDTVFNRLQSAALAAELSERVNDLDTTEARSVADVISLAEQCADGTHLYLWCVGD